MIIYVYKLTNGARKKGKAVSFAIDVFTADTIGNEPDEKGNFKVSAYYSKPKQNQILFDAILTNCIKNNSGKGITQYNKYKIWLACKPATVFRNVMWMSELDINKAIEIFNNDIDTKISEYQEEINKLNDIKSDIHNNTKL